MAIEKVLSLPELIQAVEADRRQGKTIATTNGCFDVLHVGHVRYLQAAKAQADRLIILANSDRSVQSLKGPKRPIVSEMERAEVLAALACVDYVTIFDAQTPVDALQQIRPDVHVKGGDYNAENLPEAALLNAMGTRLVFIPLVPGRSTSTLVERIQEQSSAGCR